VRFVGGRLRLSYLSRSPFRGLILVFLADCLATEITAGHKGPASSFDLQRPRQFDSKYVGCTRSRRH